MSFLPVIPRWLLTLVLVLWCVGGSAAMGQDKVDYLRDIKPILHEKCFSCHGGLQQKVKLRVDTGVLMKKGGRNGPVVVPGDPDKSLLIQRVTAADVELRMPPDAPPLTPVQVAKVKAWIAQGALSPAGEEPERDPRDHWSFRAVQRPKVPRAKDPDGVTNPIDAFVAVEQDKRGLRQRPAAERSLLLRRLYLDLIGLPPTPEQLRSFLADESPEAYEKVVDKLLAAPQYGERWARHWMDVWRYSDWYGRRMVPDVWNSAPQIWRWRDWIVTSLNQDKGYDRMVQEMLAGDEMFPEDAQAAAATGYLVRNWYALNPNDWMRANVEHTAKGFLGLTFNCAHCHDHKYDPISHEDYFRFRAFFETIGIRQERVPGEADPGVFQEYDYSVLRKIQRLGMVRIYDKNLTAPTWFYSGGDERNRVKDKGSIAPGVPAFLGKTAIKPLELPLASHYPGMRPEILDSMRQERIKAIDQADKDLAAARLAGKKTLPALRGRLERFEAELAAAAQEGGEQGALAGQQSLLLDATTGRRTLHHRLPGLKKLGDGAMVRFDLQILQDAHLNFQFAKDVAKGLTASFVAFDKGRIIAYRPGGFTEFIYGKYDLGGGQNRFEVALVLNSKADQCLLTVTSKVDGRVLVAAVPVALNGWNPVGDATKAITFDARPGSVALVDDVALFGGKDRLAHFDFEAPRYVDGRDVGGVDGWEVSSFSQAPATSIVSRTAGSAELRVLNAKVRLARRAVEVEELKEKVALRKVAAGKLELASLEARIAAERGKHGLAKNVDQAQLGRAASQSERAAAVAVAEANLLAIEGSLAAAELKPAGDPVRAKEMAVAAKQLTAARTALDVAMAKLKDDKIAYSPLGPVFPSQSSGRRRALVEWMTSRDNPLTARVAINHIWLRHFHAPLAASVYDFGRNGAAPTHPELLDWLAAELMENGWRMKHVHRLIVTSQAYQRASSVGANLESARIDPENKYLWRMNTGKMEAEVVRDSLLFCANQLDQTLGGQELENSQALTTKRRSLYYSCHPEGDGKSEFSALFDAAEATECYRRTRTILPQQALALTNSELVHALSGALAKALVTGLPAKEQGAAEAFVVAAFERILSRTPTAGELKTCTDFLRVPEAAAPEATMRVRESLVRALLNHNDFVTIR